MTEFIDYWLRYIYVSNSTKSETSSFICTCVNRKVFMWWTASFYTVRFYILVSSHLVVMTHNVYVWTKITVTVTFMKYIFLIKIYELPKPLTFNSILVSTSFSCGMNNFMNTRNGLHCPCDKTCPCMYVYCSVWVCMQNDYQKLYVIDTINCMT